MIDLKSICAEMEDDVQSVIDWVNEIYQARFADFFQGQRELFKRLESKTHPITDEELEWILTTIPLELFTVSEKLSELKIAQEVVKMRNRKELAEKKEQSTQTAQTRKQEEAELQMLEKKLVDTVYAAIIARVDSEISFSRELIMGAKKIWDRRRQTEESSPINPVDPQLPQQPVHKTFYEQTQAALKNQQPIYGNY